jgi:hypothetical protein
MYDGRGGALLRVWRGPGAMGEKTLDACEHGGRRKNQSERSVPQIDTVRIFCSKVCVILNPFKNLRGSGGVQGDERNRRSPSLSFGIHLSEARNLLLEGLPGLENAVSTDQLRRRETPVDRECETRRRGTRLRAWRRNRILIPRLPIKSVDPDEDISEPESPGPLLLLGKQQESLHHLSDPRLGKRCSVVRTPGEASIETMISILKPTAVLLEASELYLEGRTLLSRLKERSADSRVIFLDVEGLWALLMEFESEETNDLRIHPCSVEALEETLMKFLGY